MTVSKIQAVLSIMVFTTFLLVHDYRLITGYIDFIDYQSKRTPSTFLVDPVFSLRLACRLQAAGFSSCSDPADSLGV